MNDDEARPHFIDAALSRAFQGTIRTHRQSVNRVSQAGEKCRRRLLWNRTRWNEAKPYDEWLARLFTRGNLIEKEIVRLLEESGLEVLQRQRDVEWRAFDLVGHIDGILRPENGPEGPLEVKSCARWIFDSIAKAPLAADLLKRDDHLAKYPIQTGLYCLAGSWRRGWILFVCADTLRTRVVEVSLDDDEILTACENSLARLKSVNEAIAHGEDLPAEPGDHCKRCPFLGPCAPPRTWETTTFLVEDPGGELEAKLKRRMELQPLSSEFTSLDGELRERLPQREGDFLVGEVLVTIKEIETTRYPLTDEQKKKFGKRVKEMRRKYERIGKGD